MKLAIINGSTRPGNVTANEVKWVLKAAQKLEGVEATVIDLADYPMPFMDEPVSPKYNPERQPSPEVQKWMDAIAGYDAYFWVTPEYNHSVPGVLKNALDYLTFELVRKPSAIASHGSVNGARAIMALKEILAELSTPIVGSIGVSGFPPALNADGELSAEALANPYGAQTQLEGLLAELKWYADALAVANKA